MEGDLERKISHDRSDIQIRTLLLIIKNVDTLYSELYLDLISKYISNSEDVDRWNSLKPEDKIASLPKVLESLRGRWISDLATQFCPSNLNQGIAKNVALQILKRAVEKGDLESEIADSESKYRKSISVFLVSENIVKQLGYEYFVLYNEERRIYYPTKKGWSLIATRGGYASFEQFKGVHGLSKEQRILNSRKAGKKGGATTSRNKSGIHAQNIQERQELGRQLAIASGMEVWSENDINYLIALVSNSEYMYPEGHNHYGLPNWQKITEELNSTNGMTRSKIAVKLMYHKIFHQ